MILAPTASMESIVVSITVPNSEEDEWVTLFGEHGSTGVQVQDFESEQITLRAFFPAEPVEPLEPILNQIRSSTQLSIRQSLSLERVPDEDWLKLWRDSLNPFNVGDTFLVVPASSPSQSEREDVRTRILIEPGMAFGTGTHESTQLCMKALERLELKGRTILDVGTGAGILAIASALREAGWIYACDIDPVAVDVARQNVLLNHKAGRILTWTGSVDSVRSSHVEICFANLTANIFEDLWPEFQRVLVADGRIVCSGILREQGALFQQQLQRHHFRLEQMELLNDWMGFVAQKES